jgi:hypothetical protein
VEKTHSARVPYFIIPSAAPSGDLSSAFSISLEIVTCRLLAGRFVWKSLAS